MRTRLERAEPDREAACWALYQRIFSAEMRMKCFLGESARDLPELEAELEVDGRGDDDVTRAIVCFV